MRRTEIEALGGLAGDALAAGGALIRDLHLGIASRPFAALGPSAAPVRVLHDGISGAVYGGVRGGLRLAAAGGARVLARRADPQAPPLDGTPRASAALSALNGAFGDRLAADRSELALTMTVRRRGEDVPLSADGLARAFPAATGRIAVFVHGLCEDDLAWRMPPVHGPRHGGRPYGERLRDELGFTPVDLRYNTGLHVSANGRALAALLEDLVDGWPVETGEIVLVGHSMGGLVARSACHYGEAGGHRWTGAVRHVFCLGTPHLGADLEKGVHLLGWALGRLPETRPLATALAARSVGIKDLRFGACVDEDWSGSEADEFLRDRCTEVPFLADANYYFIGARLNAGPLGRALGDLLVRIPSASGRGRHRRIPFEVDNGLELDGLTHFDLLHHPAVYDQLRTWISRAPGRGRALPAPAGG
jgi:hypothetical protein